MDDGIEAQIRSLANEPKFKLAAAYLIKFLDDKENQVADEPRPPNHATAYLFEAISKQAMAASLIAGYHSGNEDYYHKSVDKAIQGLKLKLEALGDHHERTRGDRRKTGSDTTGIKVL